MDLVLDQAIELLERTPRVLRSLLEDLSDPWLSANEGPDTFSPSDVVGHLIHAEEADWIPRVMIIVQHGEAQPFTPFDRFGFRQKYQGMPISELLDRFSISRRDSLERLLSLDLQPHELELAGTHPDLGRVTLQQLLATWVVHDLTHIAQIVRVMAKQYDMAVGPWKGYTSILRER